MELTELGTEQGFMKCGFFGSNKSGKTYTGARLLMALRAHFKDDGTIAIFDTENSSQYIVPMIKEHTGITPIGFKSRNFDDLAKFIRKCQETLYLLVQSPIRIFFDCGRIGIKDNAMNT